MQTVDVKPYNDQPFTAQQMAQLETYEQALALQLAAMPKRFEHSLRVADLAEEIARQYGIDPFQAKVAGILHDWNKATDVEQLIAICSDYHMDFGCDIHKVTPLLHGKVAEVELAQVFPELGKAVLHAIGVHTTGALKMSPLDMCLFTADSLDPGRKVKVIDDLRATLGQRPLDRVYADAYCNGMVYVIDGRRYLWPDSVAIYNSYVQ